MTGTILWEPGENGFCRGVAYGNDGVIEVQKVPENLKDSFGKAFHEQYIGAEKPFDLVKAEKALRESGLVFSGNSLDSGMEPAFKQVLKSDENASA